MKRILKIVPIPAAGVMLGCASLGNLLQPYSEVMRWLFGGIALFLFFALILKGILLYQDVKKDFQDPIFTSVSPTFAMGTMLLSVYFQPFLGSVSFVIWICAIVLHLIIMVYFTIKFMLKLDIKRVHASYFIVYVGIAVAGVTAPAYDMYLLGTAIFWFAFVCMLLLLPLIIYRYIRHKQMEDVSKPLFCILTAPASLCLTAYLKTSITPNIYLVILMLILATVLYLVVLVRLIRLLRLDFYPSYAAFTFPFVISATASNLSGQFLANSGYDIPLISYLSAVETVIAIIMVCYTLVRYTMFFFKENKKTEKALK